MLFDHLEITEDSRPVLLQDWYWNDFLTPAVIRWKTEMQSFEEAKFLFEEKIKQMLDILIEGHLNCDPSGIFQYYAVIDRIKPRVRSPIIIYSDILRWKPQNGNDSGDFPHFLETFFHLERQEAFDAAFVLLRAAHCEKWPLIEKIGTELHAGAVKDPLKAASAKAKKRPRSEPQPSPRSEPQPAALQSLLRPELDAARLEMQAS